MKNKENNVLTSEACINYSLINSEIDRRVQIGLIGKEFQSPQDQINNYLSRLSIVDPVIDQLTDNLIEGLVWKQKPKIILTVPVVGTGNQEVTVIEKTLRNLADDPLIKSGEAGVLLLVNRPSGYLSDETYNVTKKISDNLDINSISLDLDVSPNIGNSSGPFANEMATETNQVPIGLLRDILSVSAMKIWSKSIDNTPPPILQMDGDFEGFQKGNLQTLLDQFDDSKTKFIQCTSDWDSREIPTDSIPEMKLGSNLMKELPQIIKLPLNNNLPENTRKQIIFGEAIQRGIQVPQAERMESIAKKGGYGLSRLREDELDQNIRTSEFVNQNGVRTTDEVVFLWSNRRAVESWLTNGQPPISQWINEFSVSDPVRDNTSRVSFISPDTDIGVVNKTLARLPLPRQLPGVYDDFRESVENIVSTLRPNLRFDNPQRKGDDLYFIQVK